MRSYISKWMLILICCASSAYGMEKIRALFGIQKKPASQKLDKEKNAHAVISIQAINQTLQDQEQAKKAQAQQKEQNIKLWHTLFRFNLATPQKIQKRLKEGANPNCSYPNFADIKQRKKPLEFLIFDDRYEETPENNNVALAQPLIEHDANVNQQVTISDSAGKTRVVHLAYFALLMKRADMVDLLLRNENVAITEFELKQMHADLAKMQIQSVLRRSEIPEHQRRMRVMKVALLGRQEKAKNLSKDLIDRVRHSISSTSFKDIDGNVLITIIIDFMGEPTSSMLYPQVEVLE